jgi:cystinosin
LRSFLAWSVSFYPQPLLNLQRRSTKGALIDYPAINFLGFTFLFLSTTLFYAHPAIRAQYAARNPQFPEPTVQPNDVAFAAHAWVLTAITITQYWPWLWGFAQKKGQRPRGYVTATAIGCIVGVMWITILVGTRGGNDSSTWAWIDVVSSATVLL